MKKFLPPLLFMILMTLTAFGQKDMTTPNGWTYEVVKKGFGPNLTKDQAAETHNQLVDAKGRILVSTYSIGIPDYQVISELSPPFQSACSVMQAGGKYHFKIPIEEFKKAAKKGGSLDLPGEFISWEVECLKVLPAMPDIATVTKKTIRTEGLEVAFKNFQKHANSRGGGVYMGEWEVNEVGYLFLNQNKEKAALEVFQYNVQQHPNSSNAHDSLAESYLKTGNKTLAASHYKRSLELNSRNENAKKMLEELGM